MDHNKVHHISHRLKAGDNSGQLVMGKREERSGGVRPFRSWMTQMTHSDGILPVSRCPPCHHNGHISVPSPRPVTSLISQLHSSSSKCHENWQFLIFSRFPARPPASYYVTLGASQNPAPPLDAIFPLLKSIWRLGATVSPDCITSLVSPYRGNYAQYPQ